MVTPMMWFLIDVGSTVFLFLPFDVAIEVGDQEPIFRLPHLQTVPTWILVAGCSFISLVL
jgi:hypothetical protein